MKNNEFKFLAGLVGFIGAAILYGIHEDNQTRRYEAEQMALRPPEYWKAQEAESQASIEKHRLSLESKERLALDKRKRDDQHYAMKLNFEKEAPDSYWQAKQTEEIERSRRERDKLRAESEERIAKEHSEAIKASSKVLSNSISNSHYGL